MTYNLYTGSELQVAELIQQRRLQLLVHSYIYYKMNHNVISDKKWDEWAKELVKLQKEYPEISENVVYYEAFKDWDASSGAFLPLDDPWVVSKAMVMSGKAVNRKPPKPQKKNSIDEYLRRKKKK